MGRASGMADALRCLEFDVARYQDRVVRSTANLLCGYPFFIAIIVLFAVSAGRVGLFRSAVPIICSWLLLGF